MHVQCPYCLIADRYAVLQTYRYFYLCVCNACQRLFIKNKEN